MGFSYLLVRLLKWASVFPSMQEVLSSTLSYWSFNLCCFKFSPLPNAGKLLKAKNDQEL